MRFPLFIVTGAPGAGKSAVVKAMLSLHSDIVAFDIDWLIDSASALVGRDIHFDTTTWRPYRQVWFDVLLAVSRNGGRPLLFAPFDLDDVAGDRLPAWCDRLEMLLLDCDDATRLARLEQREGWTAPRIREALEDAAILRHQIQNRINSSSETPEQLARLVVQWMEEFSKL